MQAASIPALAISVIALIISIYGVLERRQIARQADRLRLSAILDELSSLQLDHARANLDTPDEDLISGINGRRELLCAQALPLLDRFGRVITSPEFRTLAHALRRAGYPLEADETWHHAIAAAEGATQTLFAHRGYAFYLFDVSRPGDARTQMRHAIAAAAGPSETAIVERVKTLVFWAKEEKMIDPAGDEAEKLRVEATELIAMVSTTDRRTALLTLLDENT